MPSVLKKKKKKELYSQEKHQIVNSGYLGVTTRTWGGEDSPFFFVHFLVCVCLYIHQHTHKHSAYVYRHTHTYICKLCNHLFLHYKQKTVPKERKKLRQIPLLNMFLFKKDKQVF